MVPDEGIEPPTFGLQIMSSTFSWRRMPSLYDLIPFRFFICTVTLWLIESRHYAPFGGAHSEHSMRLTDISIKALKPPAKGHVTHRDDTIPGFGARLSQGGTKSFFLMHGRPRERLQIGRVGVISLADARAASRLRMTRTGGISFTD
jgi:hypothetical protein